jgi:hypothetical protein
MVKLPYKGEVVEATPVEFLTRKEDFNEYQLDDGKILRVKLVVSRVVRVEGKNNADGSQVYIFSSTNVVAPVE